MEDLEQLYADCYNEHWSRGNHSFEVAEVITGKEIESELRSSHMQKLGNYMQNKYKELRAKEWGTILQYPYVQMESFCNGFST